MNRALILAATAPLAITATVAALAAVPAGDPPAGKPLFKQCVSCHGVEGEGGAIGPSLRGVVGRKAASDPDFAYSAAMKRSGKTWTEAELTGFLLRPQAAVPGTRMAYAGAGSPQNASALTAYLATLR